MTLKRVCLVRQWPEATPYPCGSSCVFLQELFSNRKMRLKLSRSCGGFGSTVKGGAGLGPLPRCHRERPAARPMYATVRRSYRWPEASPSPCLASRSLTATRSGSFCVGNTHPCSGSFCIGKGCQLTILWLGAKLLVDLNERLKTLFMWPPLSLTALRFSLNRSGLLIGTDNDSS